MNNSSLKRFAVYGSIAVTASLGTLLAVRARAAGIPEADVLTYTGYLEDGEGRPLSGDHSVDVSFWESAEATSDLCIGSNAAAPGVQSGRFQVPLPQECAEAVKASSDIWVSVKVDGGELGRTKLGAVPFAIEAGHASSADAATPGGALAQQTVPPGAVMAFDLAACPEGWSEFKEARARTLVGTNPSAGAGLSAWTRGQTRGEETHTQQLAEVPTHSHTIGVFGGSGTFTNNATGLVVNGGTQVASTFGSSGPSTTAGEGKPFNVLQPSIALLYCKKGAP